MSKKEGVVDKNKLSMMFPSSAKVLKKLEALIGHVGVWDYDMGLADRALYLAYINLSNGHKVEIAIDSEHPECYLAVNVVGISKKKVNQPVKKAVADKIIKSGVQLTNPNSGFKMTAFHQSYVDNQVMNEVKDIVCRIIPLL